MIGFTILLGLKVYVNKSCEIYYSINDYQMNNKSHDFHLLKLSILRE